MFTGRFGGQFTDSVFQASEQSPGPGAYANCKSFNKLHKVRKEGYQHKGVRVLGWQDSGKLRDHA